MATVKMSCEVWGEEGRGGLEIFQRREGEKAEIARGKNIRGGIDL